MKQGLKKGFTLIELLIVLLILGVISGIVVTAFASYRKHNAVMFATAKARAILEEARNLTLDSKGDYQYGVYFQPQTAILFKGDTFVNGASTNKLLNLGSNTTFAYVNLNGGGVTVLFDRLTGETSQYGTIEIALDASTTRKTLRVYKTGLIEEQ